MGTVAAFKSKQEPDGPQALIAALVIALEPHVRRIAEEVYRDEEDLRAYTYESAKERLEVSDYVLKQMIAEGTLETVKPTVGTVRITARSIRRFLYGDTVGGALASPSEVTQ